MTHKADFHETHAISTKFVKESYSGFLENLASGSVVDVKLQSNGRTCFPLKLFFFYFVKNADI